MTSHDVMSMSCDTLPCHTTRGGRPLYVHHVPNTVRLTSSQLAEEYSAMCVHPIPTDSIFSLKCYAVSGSQRVQCSEVSSQTGSWWHCPALDVRSGCYSWPVRKYMSSDQVGKPVIPVRVMGSTCCSDKMLAANFCVSSRRLCIRLWIVVWKNGSMGVRESELPVQLHCEGYDGRIEGDTGKRTTSYSSFQRAITSGHHHH